MGHHQHIKPVLKWASRHALNSYIPAFSASLEAKIKVHSDVLRIGCDCFGGGEQMRPYNQQAASLKSENLQKEKKENPTMPSRASLRPFTCHLLIKPPFFNPILGFWVFLFCSQIPLDTSPPIDGSEVDGFHPASGSQMLEVAPLSHRGPSERF